MSVLENLQPQKVFHYFEEICNIPHGSRNTKQISDYLVQFAKDHNLTYYQDDLNNVIILKDATAGYENSEPIIIQGHMDMVCEKENDCDIDFEKDGIRLMIDGDFVTADQTTLGGDDGIAVAYALAILDSDDIPHPALEIVITVDEEIGMLGAFNMDLSMLKGHKMLNIDSDVEGHFLTSCAGGMSLIADIPVKRTTQVGLATEITLTGLVGGHSGSEIDKEHGNADILMGRVFSTLAEVTPFGVIDMAGGLKDNAIPRECRATILLPEENINAVTDTLRTLETALKNEYIKSDAGLRILVNPIGIQKADILDYASVNRVLCYLRMVPNGVLHMSQIMSGLVETSLNLGILELKENSLHTVTSIRSSVSSRKEEVKERVAMVVELLGGEITIEGDYPAWEYKDQSDVRTEIAAVYKDLFGKEPIFEAIHAGLECGIFSEKIKNLDCVSFGPNNYDIHTPKERLSISSTERMWKLILEFLKRA
ncbi:MAG: aminoacyl-histidine dipeptidase [Agathobacter sp.]|nr:aminoacyl-histidine dipeptidase [Agathobacter sp.]